MLLKDYIEKRLSEVDLISTPRIHLLKAWAEEMAHEYNQVQKLNLLFICTHNSRRSQFAQAWGTAAAAYFGFKNIHSFSGGTEVTACHENTVKGLKSAGFKHPPVGREENTHYRFTATEPETEFVLYSKLYDDPANPQNRFFALMTCSSADQNCPFIPASIARIPLNYEDPKISDGQANEGQVYALRCAEIAREILFSFKLLKSLIQNPS